MKNNNEPTSSTSCSDTRAESAQTALSCDESLKLSNQLCHRFYVVSNAITRAYRPFLLALDLTYPQYVVMMALWEKDHVEVCQLQQKTMIDSGALTLILKKMAEKSLIEVAASTVDKRRKIITLTSQGAALHDRAMQATSRLSCGDIALAAIEKETLTALMDKLKVDLLSDCAQSDSKQ